MADPIRLAIVAVLAAASLSGASLAAAAEPGAVAEQTPNCPNPNSGGGLAPSSPRRPQPPAELPQDVQIEAESVEGTRDGEMKLNGEVVITQGDRRIKTRDAIYDQQDQSFEVKQGIEYSDSGLTVKGAGAHVDPAGGAVFEGAEFALPDTNARGSADRIRATAEGMLSLDRVRYTTCPLGNQDWMLTASDIDINQRSAIGTGRGVRVDFKGVPILYTPFISFPVGNERKSGFLFPTPGTSSRSGYSLSVPWYWNIAPNYDATLTPTYYSKRGARMDTELRYLDPFGKAQLDVAYLPDDQQFGTDRSLVRFTDQSDFTRRLRLNLDGANASDDQWFEDFGMGPEGTSVNYLNRSASLTYLDERWFAVLNAQNFQTIDFPLNGVPQIAPLNRPYTVVPQLAMHASFPDQAFGLTWGTDMEVGNFQHNVAGLRTGMRGDFAPEIRMPLRAAGVYIEPAVSWRYTTYRIDDDTNPVGAQATLTRSAPILSVDGGLVFERAFGSRKQRTSTIEPRFMYLYVPFRNQNNLPVFDTGLPDLNLVQLFRTNRYVGADRLGDANQVAIGLTSRLLDSESGDQFISGTVGQAYYFDRPRVTLPGEMPDDPEFSDIIAELNLRAYADWNISAGVQWDPGDTRSERGSVQIQYRPEHDRVMNLGYRFRRDRLNQSVSLGQPDSLEQVDGSVAWPLGTQWSVYGRMVYSLEDDSDIGLTDPTTTTARRDYGGAIDQFAGFEYRSCCWRLRMVARRSVSDRTGDLDTSVLLQLELNGLSNVGEGADTFLEQSIRGYSLAAPPGY